MEVRWNERRPPLHHPENPLCLLHLGYGLPLPFRSPSKAPGHLGDAWWHHLRPQPHWFLLWLWYLRLFKSLNPIPAAEEAAVSYQCQHSLTNTNFLIFILHTCLFYFDPHSKPGISFDLIVQKSLISVDFFALTLGSTHWEWHSSGMFEVKTDNPTTQPILKDRNLYIEVWNKNDQTPASYKSYKCVE